MRKVKIAACSLSQWAMDFEGNLRRILESIRISKEKGARYRIGPELEISGYGCADHFLENDTLLHSWESLVCILENKVCENIIVDVGMPVMFHHVVYNCRVIILNKKILLIRPKKFLAGDGNYREQRWFSPWTRTYELDEVELPPIISKVTGQRKAPFGDALICTLDTMVGCETCEELFVPSSPHTNMALQGVEIFTNSSGSYHELRKLNKRINLISQATAKNGGIYVYANLKGCDGERVYYDGSSLIFKNGNLISQSEQFSLEEVDVIVATVNLDDVKTHRRNPNFGIQSGSSPRYKTIDVDFNLVLSENILLPESPIMEPMIHKAEEEIALGPACWLWDYLRRSGCGGFFLPLSGGIDSSSTACIVASMCRLVIKAVNHGNAQVLSNIRNVVKDNQYVPSDPKELCNRIFVTCYMGTENSSEDTKERAKNLARDIGSYHLGIVIDTAIKAMISIFVNVTNKFPRFRIHGGTETENLALQNIQARTRMVLSYLFAQLTLWSRGSGGSLLVLGSANVDESLLGYMTKYDCSSADLNPIGGISKTDLKKFVFYCVEKFDFTSLIGILGAQPTAELEPLKDGQIQQTDEEDIGLTYKELSMFGRLRKIHKCGPFSMFMKLVTEWQLPPAAIADKVKIFFRKYAINRHKMTVVTPAYHAEAYSPDDNRFDLRPFLYRSSWPWQFRSIDRAVANTNKALITSHIDRSMNVGNSAVARDLTQTTLASNSNYQTRNSAYATPPTHHRSPPAHRSSPPMHRRSPPTNRPSPPYVPDNEIEKKRIKLEPL